MTKKSKVGDHPIEMATPPATDLEGVAQEGDIDVASMILGTEASEEEVGTAALPPNSTEPEWSDWVMGKFEEDELVDGKPTVAGLRRVGELLLGSLTDSLTYVIQAPNTTNGDRAVCEHELGFELAGGGFLRVRDVGDVYPGNCDPKMAVFATAYAGTRAEARAYRKALRLRVVASEETAPSLKGVFEEPPPKTINQTQLNMLDALCRRLNIDAFKFMNNGPSGNKFDSPRAVPYNTAIQIIQAIQKYQQVPASIPEEIKGYQANWSGT